MNYSSHNFSRSMFPSTRNIHELFHPSLPYSLFSLQSL